VSNGGARGSVVVQALRYKPEGLPAALGPAVYSAPSRKIMFLGSRALPVRRADNLTAICEPSV
jgi:hypothetical protein